MAAETFILNPSCTPDTWLLWIGTGRLGAAAIDSSNRQIKTIGYHSLDLYQPDQLRAAAAAAFGNNTSIRNITVALRLDAWCWTPASEGDGTGVVEKWIRPFFPQRIGHSWVSDTHGPEEAVAWVEVPAHLLAQLQALCPQVSFRHAAGFGQKDQLADEHSLELMRVGNCCWFTLWQQGKFIYGQPHIVETNEDLLYLLGLLAEKFELNTAELTLKLSGEWETGSDWLPLLRRYFSKIEGRDGAFAQEALEVPGHWFTPLADLLP